MVDQDMCVGQRAEGRRSAQCGEVAHLKATSSRWISLGIWMRACDMGQTYPFLPLVPIAGIDTATKGSALAP